MNLIKVFIISLFITIFGNAAFIKLYKGWNLISMQESNLSKLDNSIKLIWKYKNANWYAYSNNPSIKSKIDSLKISNIKEIKNDEGVWILSAEDKNITINSNRVEKYSIIKGWNLLGINRAVKPSLFFDTCISYLWQYDSINKNWKFYRNGGINRYFNFEKIKIINANSGFWGYAKENCEINLSKEEPLSFYLKKHNLKLLIPMYVYPSPSSIEWRRLIDFKKVHPNIDMIVIVNPNNGVFDNIDLNYEKLVKKLFEVNITMVGYVYTKYGKRDINEVKSNIDNWEKFYKNLGISGIFFDEASSKANEIGYYKELSDYVKNKGFKIVITNPGTKIDKAYIDENISDIIIDHEDSYENLSNMKSWNMPTSNTSLAILVYGLNNSDDLKDIIAKAIDNNISYIYLTDKTINPWNSFSKYLYLKSPYSKREFQEVLKVSKLQCPTSKYDSLWGTHYGEFKGVSHRYFYLDENNLVDFAMCGDKNRSELRFQNDWNVSSENPKTIEAELKVKPLDKKIEQFTFLQIHSDGTKEGAINSPLLRIVWKRNYKKESNHLWAVLKLDANESNYKEFDLSKLSDKLFTIKVSVVNNRLNLWFNGIKKLDSIDVSYWDKIPSYFKAGVYLQSDGCAKSSFDDINVSY